MAHCCEIEPQSISVETDGQWSWRTSPADISLRNALERTTNIVTMCRMIGQGFLNRSQQLDPQLPKVRCWTWSQARASTEFQDTKFGHGTGYPRPSFSMQCREALARLGRPDAFLNQCLFRCCCLLNHRVSPASRCVQVWYAGVCCHYGLRPDEHGRLFWIVLTWTCCTDT